MPRDVLVIQVDSETVDAPASRRPRVCVIVVNWNRPADTLECLTSLAQQTYPSCEVIVVDNGSTDGSAAAIQAAFPDVTVLVNATNLGFGEGNNVGLKYALARGADHVLLLNNDTIVDPALIDQLVQVAESDDHIAAVGAKIFFYSDPRRLWSAGSIVNYTETVTRLRGYRQIDQGQFEQIEEVDCVSGCAMLLRRQALEQIGLLDPLFSPAYFEDTDWCMRARRVGQRIVYAPAAMLWHRVSMSGGGEYNVRERYLIGFNSIQFMRRYANAGAWLKFFLYAIVSLPLLYLVRVFQGRGRGVAAKGLGLWDGLRGVRRDTYLK
jgi:GT2 family glycosyltransferase